MSAVYTRPVFEIEETQTLPSYFCVRASERCHTLTKAALCHACYRDLPLNELRKWPAIDLHTVEIGYDIPGRIECSKCSERLSFARLGTSCNLCTAKFNEFYRDPANIDKLINNFEQILVLRSEEILQLPNLFR